MTVIRFFTTESTEITESEGTLLSWKVEDPIGPCIVDNTVGTVNPQGTLRVEPAVTTTYTLTCNNESAQVTITVLEDTTKKEFKRLTSHIPDVYKPSGNKYWRGVLKAVATGDAQVQNAIRQTRDQIFIKTAAGKFLDRIGSNVGVERFASIGFRDDDYRELIPALSYAPKQVKSVLNDLLRIWYKEQSVFAHTTTTVPEPYFLRDGDNLKILIDKTDEIDIVFENDDFEDITSISAAELATAINKKATDLGITARNITTTATRQRFIRIFSNTQGPAGEVQILGGTAQTSLQFPVLRNTEQNTVSLLGANNLTGPDTISVAANTPTAGQATYTIAGAGGSWVVSPNTDYILDVSLAALDPANKGQFPVISATASTIVVTSSSGVSEGPVPLTATTDLQINTHWSIQLVTGSTVRLEYRSGKDPKLENVFPGDIVILGDAFNSSNQGSFLITDVVLGATIDGSPGKTFTGDYVEFENVNIIDELDASQTSNFDVQFFFPEKFDINDLDRPAVFYETVNKELVFNIPATAGVVGRDLDGSAHIHINSTGQNASIGLQTGLDFKIGDTLIAADALYLSGGGGGDFAEGEVVAGGSGTGNVAKIISNDIDNTILILDPSSVAGSFSGIITGGTSGATRAFSKIISPVSSESAVITSIVPSDSVIGWAPTESFNNGVGLLGRSSIVGQTLSGTFVEGETISTANAMYLKTPWDKTFTVGETLRGRTSSAEATVDAVLLDKTSNIILLQVTPTLGTFVADEIVDGLTSTAFASFIKIILSSGNSTTINTLETMNEKWVSALTDLLVGNFNIGEIFIGGTSGAKAIMGFHDTSAAILLNQFLDEEFNGPYLFDPQAEFTISSVFASLTQDIDAGTNLTFFTVDALPESWPSGVGRFVLDFGSDRQEGPIKFISKQSDQVLKVDPAYTFQKDHPTGSVVRLISQLGAFVPDSDGSDFLFFLTDTDEAREILQDLIRESVAAGIKLRFNVSFPEYPFGPFLPDGPL